MLERDGAAMVALTQGNRRVDEVGEVVRVARVEGKVWSDEDGRGMVMVNTESEVAKHSDTSCVMRRLCDEEHKRIHLNGVILKTDGILGSLERLVQRAEVSLVSTMFVGEEEVLGMVVQPLLKVPAVADASKLKVLVGATQWGSAAGGGLTLHDFVPKGSQFELLVALMNVNSVCEALFGKWPRTMWGEMIVLITTDADAISVSTEFKCWVMETNWAEMWRELYINRKEDLSDGRWLVRWSTLSKRVPLNRDAEWRWQANLGRRSLASPTQSVRAAVEVTPPPAKRQRPSSSEGSAVGSGDQPLCIRNLGHSLKVARDGKPPQPCTLANCLFSHKLEGLAKADVIASVKGSRVRSLQGEGNQGYKDTMITAVSKSSLF